MSTESEGLLKQLVKKFKDLTSPAYAEGKSYVLTSTNTDYTTSDFGNDVVMIELREDTNFNVLEMDNVVDIDSNTKSTIYQGTTLKKTEDKIIYGHPVKINISSGSVRLIKK